MWGRASTEGVRGDLEEGQVAALDPTTTSREEVELEDRPPGVVSLLGRQAAVITVLTAITSAESSTSASTSATCLATALGDGRLQTWFWEMMTCLTDRNKNTVRKLYIWNRQSLT